MNLMDSSFFLAVSRISYKKKKEFLQGNLPGGPVVKTPHFHCRGLGFDPGWGTKIPQAAQGGQKKKKGISHMKLILPGSLIFPSTRSTPSAHKGAPSSSHLTESLFHPTWRRKWQPTSVFLPGESQGQGSLPGCSPWGHKESDVT